MAKSAHPMYVNKRLSAARQLISLSQTYSESSPLLANVLVESAVLQLRLGFAHYLNELLEAYQRPLINIDIVNLAKVIHQEKTSVAELQEYVQLLDDETSWLSILNIYPHQLLTEADKKSSVESGEASQSQQGDILRLIDVDNNHSETTHPLSSTSASWLLDQVVAVIQRQREHLIEC